MTTDSGFAPNPFLGVLTLATCKPAIRRSPNIEVGDWISGWSSRKLCGDAVGAEKLVYLAKIKAIVSISEYWEKYPQKRNNGKNDKSLESFGDNIYESDGTGGFVWHENTHHPKTQTKTDTGGKNVIVCEEFYYFGKEHKLDVSRFSIRKPTTKGHRIIDVSSNQSEIFEDFKTFVKNEFDNLISNSGLSKDDFIKNSKGVSNDLILSKPSTCCKK